MAGTAHIEEQNKQYVQRETAHQLALIAYMEVEDRKPLNISAGPNWENRYDQSEVM